MKTFKRITAVLVLVITVLSFCSCGKASKLAGRWHCETDINHGYPDQLVLNEDGTGSADGYGLNWYADDSILHLSISLIGTKEYYYSITSGVLHLDDYIYLDENTKTEDEAINNAAIGMLFGIIAVLAVIVIVVCIASAKDFPKGGNDTSGELYAHYRGDEPGNDILQTNEKENNSEIQTTAEDVEIIQAINDSVSSEESEEDVSQDASDVLNNAESDDESEEDTTDIPAVPGPAEVVVHGCECGHLVDSNMVYCPWCGKHNKPVYCAYCGEILEANMNFCTRCGRERYRGSDV